MTQYLNLLLPAHSRNLAKQFVDHVNPEVTAGTLAVDRFDHMMANTAGQVG